jgi:predicted RNase H-like HicB family nuclease
VNDSLLIDNPVLVVYISLSVNATVRKMPRSKTNRLFTLEYWKHGDMYVGKLREVPGVFSQGKTVEELKANIADAYHMMLREDRSSVPRWTVKTLEFGIST